MFTGIITDIGTVVAIQKPSSCGLTTGSMAKKMDPAIKSQDDADLRIEIATHYKTRNINIGASVAVNGVCLTVVAKTKATLSFDISAETVSRTTLGTLTKGSDVNLEQSLKLGDALGGHIVSGHVDGQATIIEKKRAGASWVFGFSAPRKCMRFIAEKGSVALDGVSLTVNRVAGNRFWVNIIPHTLAATTFGQRSTGECVNLEIDLVARYVERLSKSG